MDRSFVMTPKSMQRSNSFSEVECKRTFLPRKTPKSKYRGRFSSGLPHNTKSTRNRKVFLDPDDVEYYEKASEKHAKSPSTFHCLSVYERESSSSSFDSSRKTSAVSLAVEDYNEDEGEARQNLFHDLGRFLSNASTVTASTVKGVSQNKKGRNEFMFGFGAKNMQYKYGDLLWLILKAYFSGRDVSRLEEGRSAESGEDSIICSSRETKWKYAAKLMNYQALRFQPQSFDLESTYLLHMTETKAVVSGMLNDWESFVHLFPTQQSLEKYVAVKMGDDYMKKLVERVDVLTAWLNTVNDLEDKISSLGELFEASRLLDASEHWPRPLVTTTNQSPRNSIGLSDARPVFRSYVEKKLNVKGMKRQLTRVLEISQVSLIKAAILLQQRPSSYAHATSRGSMKLQLDDEMKRHYEATSRYGLSSRAADEMHMPTFAPLFLFLLGVRLELVHQWLIIRSESTLPEGSEMDCLTLAAMMEDSRDCVEESVRVKKEYLNMVASTCPTYKHDLSEFDKRLKDVFQKYLDYVRCWSQGQIVNEEWAGVCSRLEMEWGPAVAAARHIHHGLDTITTTFCTLTSHLFDKLVKEFWENRIEQIMEEHFMADIGYEDRRDEDDFQEDWSRDKDVDAKTAMMFSCRGLNRLVREVKERSSRLFGLLRMQLSEMFDASGYQPIASYETISDKLAEHYWLVEFANEGTTQRPYPVCILVDSKSVDKGGVDELVTALCESCNWKKITDTIGTTGSIVTSAVGKSADLPHLIILPYKEFRSTWKSKITKCTLNDELLINLRYLRSDVMCSMGDVDLNQAYPGLDGKKTTNLFQLTKPACCTHEIVDGQFTNHAEALISLAEDVYNKMFSVWKHFNYSEQTWHSKARFHSSIQQAFTFVFQLHREVSRVVADSFKDQLGGRMVRACLEVLCGWRDVVVEISPKHASYIPNWATHSFNFLYLIADPKWSQFLTAEDFARLQKCDSDLRVAVVSLGTVEQADNDKKMMTTSRWMRFDGESRRKAHQDAVAKMEKEIANKQTFVLGQVIEKRFEPVDVKQFIDASKGPPFKYQILERIGSGSFADVFKAINLDAKCVVAVKKIRVTKNNEIKIFQGEVDILRNLSHRNLVKYYGVVVPQGEVHILMEFCAEGTLEKICSECLEMSLVRRYTHSLLQAVEYIHERKVVHRDIKPANIFLDNSCVLKLGDFGSARRLMEEGTVAGEILELAGTPQYMAPEVQSYGEKLDDGTYKGYGRSVDIWSVGCCVLQMVTGRRPWPEKVSRFMITMKVCNGEVPQIPKQATGILKSFLLQCFVFDPVKRPSANKLLRDPFANIHVDTETVQSFVHVPPGSPDYHTNLSDSFN